MQIQIKESLALINLRPEYKTADCARGPNSGHIIYTDLHDGGKKNFLMGPWGEVGGGVGGAWTYLN